MMCRHDVSPVDSRLSLSAVLLLLTECCVEDCRLDVYADVFVHGRFVTNCFINVIKSLSWEIVLSV